MNPIEQARARVSDAEAALRSEQADLAPAQAHEAKCAASRTAAAEALAEDERKLLEARRAFNANRTDERLGSRLTLAQHALDASREDAAAAQAAHEAAQRAVQEATGRIEARANALKLAKTAERRAERLPDLRELGRANFKAALDLLATAQRMQTMLAEDGADALELGEVPSDALPVAAGIATAVTEAGGCLWSQLDSVRFATHLLLPSSVSFASPATRLTQFVSAVAALTKTVTAPAPQNDAGERSQVDAWTSGSWRTYSEFCRARDQADAEARVAVHLKTVAADQIRQWDGYLPQKRTPGLVGIPGQVKLGNDPPPADHDPIAAERARIEAMPGRPTQKLLGGKTVGSR